jgi:hypothetical protein
MKPLPLKGWRAAGLAGGVPADLEDPHAACQAPQAQAEERGRVRPGHRPGPSGQVAVMPLRQERASMKTRPGMLDDDARARAVTTA